MEPLLRFLDLLQRELGADDAKLELGGRRPEGEALLVHELEGGWRLLVTFAQPLAEPQRMQARLRTLAESFSDTLTTAQDAAPSLRMTGAGTARALLDEALEQLRELTGALVALVVDRQSPMVWGATAAAAWLGVEAPLDGQLDPGTEAEALPLRTAIFQAIELARQGGDATRLAADLSSITRAFAGIYCVVLVFDRTASSLHAETAVIRALPVIERLVEGLPPVDPTPKGARLFRLPPRA